MVSAWSDEFESIFELCTWQNMLMCTLILYSVHRMLISAECECLIDILQVTLHSCVWRVGVKTCVAHTSNVVALTWFYLLQNEKQARMPCTIFSSLITMLSHFKMLAEWKRTQTVQCPQSRCVAGANKYFTNVTEINRTEENSLRRYHIVFGRYKLDIIPKIMLLFFLTVSLVWHILVMQCWCDLKMLKTA